MRKRKLHLGELVRSTAGDLCNAKEGELGLELFQLVQEVCLWFLPKLMHLDPSCIHFSQKQKKHMFSEIHKTKTELIPQSAMSLLLTHCFVVCVWLCSGGSLLLWSECMDMNETLKMRVRFRFIYKPGWSMGRAWLGSILGFLFYWVMISLIVAHLKSHSWAYGLRFGPGPGVR